MGKKSKDKGYRGERYFVDNLNKNGIIATRVPLSGALKELPGDVMLEWLGAKRDFECKWRAIGFKEIYKWIKPRRGLFIKADRQEGLVVLRISDFTELLTAANLSVKQPVGLAEEGLRLAA